MSEGSDDDVDTPAGPDWSALAAQAAAARYLASVPETASVRSLNTIAEELGVEVLSEQDWLGSYAELRHLHRAVDNMARRFRRETALPGGVAELEAAYPGFEADFLAFMPELQRFAEDFLQSEGAA